MVSGTEAAAVMWRLFSYRPERTLMREVESSTQLYQGGDNVQCLLYLLIVQEFGVMTTNEESDSGAMRSLFHTN